MRRWFLAVLAAAASVVGSTAKAQITLVPGQPISLSWAPTFVAAADFDQDGRTDLAVSSPTSSKISVLLSGVEHSFSTALDFSVGIQPRGLAAGDLNGDGIPDIAAVSLGASSLFITLSVSSNPGTFGKPAAVPLGRRRVGSNITQQGITIGDFDNLHGKDVAFIGVGGSQNGVNVVLNPVGNDIALTGPFPAGNRPTAVVAADLNGDGLDDLVVLNIGSTGADDVSVLLNSGAGSFSLPTNFVVGINAKSVAVEDVNNDGAPDIVVLNAGDPSLGGTVNATISVLLNELGNNNKGTGFFNLHTPTAISCPSKINGVPIACSPNFITLGDYNHDGLMDVAASFGAASLLSGTTVNSGIILAFAGRGDGDFDFAGQFVVGGNPQGLATADFTGDGNDDIGVAEQGTRTARILRSVPPPARDPGTACLTGLQCGTGFCVNSVCCSSSSCPRGQRCDIPGEQGMCSVPAQNGSTCTLNEQCQSGSCVDGFCCGSASCPDGQFCNTGECAPPASNGTPCRGINYGAQCASGFCVDLVCCGTATCPPPEHCNIPGMEGTCGAPLPVGTPCVTPGQCESGNCVDHTCCISDSCPQGQACDVTGAQGDCTRVPTPTPTITPTRTPTFTPTPQQNGASCDNNQQCVSAHCLDGVCCGSASCPTDQRCDIPGSAGMCAPKGGVNDVCNLNTQCTTNYCFGPDGQCTTKCQNNGTCQMQPTPTFTATPTPLKGGDFCTNTSQCQAGLFCNTAESVCCGTLNACPPGYSCRVPGQEGQCARLPATPTPTPTQRENGKDCSSGSQCASGNCFDSVCCDSVNCTAPQRCDITGFKGTCHDLLNPNDPCTTNSDCDAGLQCLSGICSLPPANTPTLIPIFTPTPVPQPAISASRSGGCSVGNGSSTAGAWMFGLVPVAFWLRARRARLRIRTQRRIGR